MASMNTISDSIKILEIKKSNLNKSIGNLEFSWRKVDDLITTVKNSVQDGLKSILYHQPQSESTPNPDPKKTLIKSNPITVRPELKSFCEKKDGMGLVSYMLSNNRYRAAIREEIEAAFRVAVAEDSVELVLDGMRWFYPKKKKKTGKNGYLSCIRRMCIALMEILAEVKPQIKAESKVEAMNLAVMWKVKMSGPGLDKLESHGFLQLLITFDLVSAFDLNEITDLFAHALVFNKGAKICKELGLIEKGTAVVQKLISNGNEIFAIRMIIQLGVSDKYPPVPLLKEYVNESVKLSEKICKDGNNSRESKLEAVAKELDTLHQVNKVVRDFNLESEYSVESRIKQLRDEKVNLKRVLMKGNWKQVLKLKKHNGDKRPQKTPELSQTDSRSSSSGAKPYGSDPIGDPYVGSGGPFMGSTLSGAHYAELRHSGGAANVGSVPNSASNVGSVPNGAPYHGSTRRDSPYAKPMHSCAPYASSTPDGSPYPELMHGAAPYVGLTPSAAPYGGSNLRGVSYGGVASTCTAYVISLSGLYGLPRVSQGFSGNVNPARSHYPSELNLPLGYNGIYGLPQAFNQSYGSQNCTFPMISVQPFDCGNLLVRRKSQLSQSGLGMYKSSISRLGISGLVSSFCSGCLVVGTGVSCRRVLEK